MIPEQLTKIYLEEETWHTQKMSYDKALEYHKTRWEKGQIHTQENEKGDVVGYYERYFVDDKCFLYNLWIHKDYRQGKVFRELYRHFFGTMPSNIKYIVGEKQKLGGKYMKALRGRR